MAPLRSAGLLVYRRRADGALEVLLAHMGGPFWARKDEGAWSIPKGEPEDGENALDAARREFAEELGQPPPAGPPMPLGSVRQRSGKVVEAWALKGDLDVSEITSTTFELEWPPRSGRVRSYPEVDRAAWLDLATARRKLLTSQAPLLDALERVLGGHPDVSPG